MLSKKGDRVWKYTTLDGQRLEGALERKWGLEGALKKMIEGSKAHSKEVEKHRDFSGGVILIGGLPMLKNSQKWKIFNSNFDLWPF